MSYGYMGELTELASFVYMLPWNQVVLPIALQIHLKA